MPTFRYAISQVAVHWLAAALIVFLLVTGTFVLDPMPDDARKVANLRIHLVLGALAGLLVITRILLRRKLPVPSAASPGDKVARLTHVALNLLVLVLVFSGAMLALQSGVFDAVFGSGPPPAGYDTYVPRRIHGLVAKLVMGLVALHVVGALFHQFVLKDRLLARMGLGRSGP